jgi:hypothetical protein
MKKIYYEKVGRKYVPVAEYDNEFLDSFTKGNHLVMCYPGGTSRRFNIEPALAPMIAAGRVAENAISKSIMDASALRVPERQKPLTPAQAEAWRRLSELFGDERYALEWCSYREAAEAGVQAMQAEADKLLKNDSVRKSYEHFQLMCKLTTEQ